MDWEQRNRAPSRFEADLEAQEEWLIATYDERLEAWCRATRRDPESVASAIEFEEAWNNTEEEEQQ